MYLKCPNCGNIGNDGLHQLLERWDDDEGPQLLAEGYDPARTSAAWFECGQCKQRHPFWQIHPARPPNDMTVNAVEDDGVTPFDPFKDVPWPQVSPLSKP